MKPHTFMRASLLALVFSLTAFAEDRYIVRTVPAPSQSIWSLAAKYSATVAKVLKVSDGQNVYLIAVPPGAIGAFKKDADVQAVEPDGTVTLPLRNFHPNSFGALPETLPRLVDSDRNVNFFGAPAWGPYVNQPAAGIIRIGESRPYATGAGIVAMIDTGADPSHPVLAPALVTGWDFTRGVSGGSEATDVNQEVTPILDQEVTPILDSGGIVIFNPDTTAQLNQEVTPILDERIPAALGHGTMTAGIVHLVAPTAKIMPLKAFNSDGTGSLSDVIAAIYWAVDHGARIISMSFDVASSSQELKQAIGYASSKQLILVASVGNDGIQIVVYPAGYNSVVGVASTSNDDVRSSFSNYGAAVMLAAPGEAIMSTFPHNRYAMGWGTSFSAPMVSGAAALLLQLDEKTNSQKAANALSQAVAIASEGMGAGRLDLVNACIYVSDH